MIKVLIGNGGHAREVTAQMGYKSLSKFRFVDDQYVDEKTLPLSQFDPTKYIVMVAVADPKDRFDIIQRLPKETKFFSFIHPTALLMDDVEIDEGSFIGAYSILTTNIKIGKHAILNRGNQIGHDCRIGDYFSAMPGAIVSGNVNIGDNVYLGTNATVIEKKQLSHNIIIGANGVVVKDIVNPGTYVGMPAKLLKK
jgi:sugar O-acyltransferase (sialic acid O-acetyltransferase NeuD family)